MQTEMTLVDTRLTGSTFPKEKSTRKPYCLEHILVPIFFIPDDFVMKPTKQWLEFSPYDTVGLILTLLVCYMVSYFWDPKIWQGKMYAILCFYVQYYFLYTFGFKCQGIYACHHSLISTCKVTPLLQVIILSPECGLSYSDPGMYQSSIILHYIVCLESQAWLLVGIYTEASEEY